MINLAQKDIYHTLPKFIVTAMGVGMLLGIVLIMIGVYRGMVVDAQVLLDDLDVDLWIVQKNTLGPFAEASRLHEDMRESIKVIDGIKESSAITFQNIQLPKGKEQIRVMAVGYEPFSSIKPIKSSRLIAGRTLKKSHYEMVLTDKTGFELDDKITLGRDIYTVVGITHGSVSSGGDSLIYISLKDAQSLQFLYANARIHTDRNRGERSANTPMVNAIVARLKEGYSINKVAEDIRRFKHKNVYTRTQEKQILTENLIKTASKQIGLFTAILVLVSTIIIALIIYTMTLEKMKEISIMKLIGIPNGIIIKMIVQETVLLGFLAFIFANVFSHLIYSKFPKRVVLEIPDAWMLFLVVIIASILSSFVGVRKVITADPTAAIGG